MAHEQPNFKMETFRGTPASSWGELYGFEAIKDYPYSPQNHNHYVGKDKDGKEVYVDTSTLLRSYLRTSIVAEAGEAFVEDVVTHGVNYVENFFEQDESGNYRVRTN